MGAKHAGRRRTGRGDRRYAQVKESPKELHPGLEGREGLGGAEAEANRWREEEEAEGDSRKSARRAVHEGRALAVLARARGQGLMRCRSWRRER